MSYYTPKELLPVIKRGFDGKTGKFKWVAVRRTRTGFGPAITPYHLIQKANYHAYKLNQQEKDNAN